MLIPCCGMHADRKARASHHQKLMQICQLSIVYWQSTCMYRFGRSLIFRITWWSSSDCGLFWSVGMVGSTWLFGPDHGGDQSRWHFWNIYRYHTNVSAIRWISVKPHINGSHAHLYLGIDDMIDTAERFVMRRCSAAGANEVYASRTQFFWSCDTSKISWVKNTSE